MCWICGGWSPATITYVPPITQKIKSIKSCVSVDSYVPFNMEYDESHNCFTIERMMPPGRINYVFIKEEQGVYGKPFINDKKDTECLSQTASNNLK